MSTIGACLLAVGLWAGADQSPASARTRAEHFTRYTDGDEQAPGQGEDPKGEKGEKKRRPKFTISKEVTYVTGPLRKDGFIDYVAALNERLSKGVTPENNAVVLIWKALGPRPEGVAMPPEFFKWLGYQPPERGDYFTTDLYEHLKEHFRKHFKEQDPTRQEKLVDSLCDRVAKRPWTAKQYPLVADWLKANTKPLALVVEGTKRPRYFSPLVPKGDDGLIGALVSGVQKCRGLANALVVRAMLHIGEGRYDEAWQDLLACHRLGRLIPQGATLIEELVGIAIDSIASEGDLAYLDRVKPTAQQIRDRLRDLRQLPPMPSVADKVDLGERFMFLDCVMMVARGGPQVLEGFAGGKRPRPLTARQKESLDRIDWDPALRNGNVWYDRMVAAMRLKSRTAREKALAEVERDVRKLKARTKPEVLAQAVLGEGPSPKAIGEAIGNIMISLLLPAVTRVQQAGDRTEQVHRNLEVAFALAAYRADHGRYPMKLEALAPKYLPEIPQDMFSGKALIYRPSEKGYLLYSVGVNGQDEQGRSYDDDPPGDDLVVRMPLPPLRRQ
jgi:hypothetical protein